MNVHRILEKLAPLAVIALTLVFFAKLAFTNLILARGDTYVYFYPYWHAASAALQAGRLPLWNDLLFMGAPFMANSQVGLFYPPNWPLWLLAPDAPTAIKWSILLHLVWAGLGMFALLRGPLRMDAFAATVGAALFAVGGHLTAHVEQINQLQGLSWLPWLFLALHNARTRPWRWGPLLAVALALQLLSGHTQTVFIGAVGLGIMALWWAWREENGGSLLRRFRLLGVLLLAGVAVALLTLPQLAPTLELTGLSNRSGGLEVNEVVSFSLHPALIGRALLPGYDIALPGEYIGTIGLAGLTLAVAGAWTARRDRTWQVWIGLAALGLFLAIGGWNPVYWLLGHLPGFNLFRVPARWLVLWALGGSALAAYAVHALIHGDVKLPRSFGLILGGGALALIATTLVAPLIASRYVPSLIFPLADALLGWLITAGVIVAAVWRLPGRWAGVTLALVAGLELFIASQRMPYNRLNAPDAFSAGRPAIEQLRAQQDETIPAGRSLSISQIMYGLSDQSMIVALFSSLQIPGDALYDLLVATKLKEVIAPNLGMVWNLPGVDGFDGGVLPLRTYTEFSQLLLGTDNPPPDGRLWENLTSIPAQRWLNLMGVRYLIADRVNDGWYADAHFDLTWRTPIEAGETVRLIDLPDFEATALALVLEAPDDLSAPLATVEVTHQGEPFTLILDSVQPAEGDTPTALAVLSWETPITPDSIQIIGQGEGLVVRGAALLDERTGVFHMLTVTPGSDWALILLGDVKIYQNMDSAPRAFLVHEAEVLPDDAAALIRMRDSAFDPAQTVILADGEPLGGAPASGTATITRYEPEYIEIALSSEDDAYLVLTDAYYPGWTATLDHEPVPIHRADVLFRAVHIPAGTHTLTMTYAPTSWPGALLAGASAWLILLGTIIAAWVRPRSPS